MRKVRIGLTVKRENMRDLKKRAAMLALKNSRTPKSQVSWEECRERISTPNEGKGLSPTHLT